MLKTLNHPVTFLIILGLFIWLSVYAWHHPAHHYKMSQSDFVQMQLAKYDGGTVPESARPKMVYVWRDAKAAAIADAFSLTPEDLDTTVDVRRMK